MENSNCSVQNEQEFITVHGEVEDPKASGYVCPICLEIYHNPVIISCGRKHIYCAGCIHQYCAGRNPECPECRGQFNPAFNQPAQHLNKKLYTVASSCPWCRVKLPLYNLKLHMPECAYSNREIPVFQPVSATSQEVPRDLPNRSTFQCPYCNQGNLDCNDLVQHCNTVHKSAEKISIVCPICASMPWGDPNLKSSDFLQHLNLRHKFEYDTYVDYSMDDDEMLQRALHASMMESQQP